MKTKCHNCLPPRTKARFIHAKGIETKDWPLCGECKTNTCPECGKRSLIEKWLETEVGCGDCGSHIAGICPECEEDVDTVHSDIELPND